jgi:hypothetical protein
MPDLTVIWWRDIPAQVIAGDRRRNHKVVLHRRFQVAIDRAAVKAGRKQWDDYLEDWRKVRRQCSDDLEEEATAEARLLEQRYPSKRLAQLVQSGGVDTTERA